MRVLQIGRYYPPYMGGMENHLQSLCNELRKKMEVEVIVANDRMTTVNEVVDGVRVSRVGTMLTVRSASICPSMLSRIRSSKAEIVHLHCPNPTAILAYLGSGHQGRLIVTYHSDIVRQKILGTLFEPILHAFLRRSAAIIVTSQKYLQTSPVLSRYFSRCRVIPYGISPTSLRSPDPAAVLRLREQYGSRFALSVGRLVYYKGFEYLVRAMARVNGKLLIAGDGPLRNSLQRLTTSLHLDQKVIFLGGIQNENLGRYYDAARCLVLPSVPRSEGVGILQLEGMTCGKPVVNTSLDSGVPFVSLDGVTGLTVAPRDSRALADAINTLLDQDELRARFGEAGRLRVKSEFSLESMTHRTLDLYQDVFADAQRGRDRISAPAKSGNESKMSASYFADVLADPLFVS